MKGSALHSEKARFIDNIYFPISETLLWVKGERDEVGVGGGGGGSIRCSCMQLPTKRLREKQHTKKHEKDCLDKIRTTMN